MSTSLPAAAPAGPPPALPGFPGLQALRALSHPHGFLTSHTIAVLSGAINFSTADPGRRQLTSKEAPSGLTAFQHKGAFHRPTRCWATGYGVARAREGAEHNP